MKFCWDPGIFRVLRVTFSTEVQQICAINYGQNLEEIINILRVWTKTPTSFHWVRF